MSWVKLAKTGHGPQSSTLVVICVLVVICLVSLLFVLFYVLFVCKCVLPPADNPIAVNKYVISYYVGLLFVVYSTSCLALNMSTAHVRTLFTFL